MTGYKKSSNDFLSLKKTCAAVFASVALVTGAVGCDNSSKPIPPAEEAVTPVANVPPVNAPTVNAPKMDRLASRGLTPAEKKLAHELFGATIDTNNIAIDFYKKDGTAVVSDVVCDRTCAINFFGNEHSKPDYTAVDVDVFGIFAHSLTHVWHMQQGDGLRYGSVKGFRYPLDSQFSFDDYGYSQQAAIIEDYARRFLHPTRVSRWTAKDYGDKSDTDPFLQRLVEDKFPSAKEARLAHSGIETRSLTDDEKNLLRGIFGSEIDVNAIRQVFHPETMTDFLASVATGTEIDYWGKNQHSGNYSCDRASVFGTQVHEATHIWQRYTDLAYTSRSYDEDKGAMAYYYRLGADLKFEDYPDERQAAIVEDYARLFLHPARKANWLNGTKQWNKNPDASRELLKKVVEDKFPEARKTRLAYEQSVQNGGGKKPYSCSMKIG